MLSPSFSGLFSIISKIPFATTNYTYGEEAALMVLSGEATFTVRRHCTCILSEGEVTLVVRRHCTALPSEGEVTLIVRRHCTCFLSEGEVTLIVRRHCTCFISEGEVTLILRRHCTCFISEGKVTLIVRRHCTCFLSWGALPSVACVEVLPSCPSRWSVLAVPTPSIWGQGHRMAVSHRPHAEIKHLVKNYICIYFLFFSRGINIKI